MKIGKISQSLALISTVAIVFGLVRVTRQYMF